MYINAKGLELTTTSTGSRAITGGAGGVRTGTSKADILDSIAGDTLKGGLGNDVYYMWDTASKISEAAGQGNDTAYIKYWGAYTLAANVENVILSSPGAISATGNTLNNLLIAGATHATLDGGAGDDILVGGAGADLFKVKIGNGSDVIYNFRPGWDSVELSGDHFSTFAQLKAAATQVGSDVSIKISGTESLILRDVKLSALDGADFGMMTKTAGPAGASTAAVNKAYNANGWYVFANAWGAGQLVAGKDYQLEGSFKTGNVIKGTTFNWSFAPSVTTNPTIKAYPEVIFGISPHNNASTNPTDTKMVLPVKVSDIVNMTSTYDVSINGNTGGFNVSYDIWLTNKAYGGKSAITNEIMVWTHKGDFAAFGALVGTYTAGGHTAEIYHKGTYTAVVFNDELPKGTVDIAGIIGKLQSLGYVSANEYVASVELGAEVVGGSGSLTINDLNLKVDSKGPNGSTISKTATGSGTTVVTNAPKPPAQSHEDADSAPPATKPPTTTPPTTTPPTSGGNLLSSAYQAGSKAMIGEHGLKIGVETTVKTTDKVTITKLDLAGQSLGQDVATMDGSKVSVSHYDGAGHLLSIDKVSYDTDATRTKIYAPDGDFVGSTKVSVENGVTTASEFYADNKLSSLIKVSVEDGVKTTTHFNTSYVVTGYDKQTTNADGSVTTEHLDRASKVTSIDVSKLSGTTTTTFHYNASHVLLGSEIATVDANGVNKTMVYDASSKLQEVIFDGSDRADTLAGSSGETHFHGGLGSDTLSGGAGADYFHFDTTIGQGDVDVIKSFKVASDTVALDHAVFTGLAVGDLASGAFVAGTKALDSADRVIFDKTTGQLWFDDDGVGAHAPILLAKVTADGALTAANFLVT